MFRTGTIKKYLNTSEKLDFRKMAVRQPVFNSVAIELYVISKFIFYLCPRLRFQEDLKDALHFYS
jgi:hypothetical protein